jgi:regulator of sigma E protease
MEIIKAIGFIVLIFGVLVGIHEFGHFLVAKLSGVWVQEFAWGFGPTIYRRRFGDTLYKINLIPLGGYVRLYGEQDFLNLVDIDQDVEELMKDKKLTKIVEDEQLYLVPEDELEDKVDSLKEKLSKEDKKRLVYISLLHEGRKNDSRRYINKPIWIRLIIVLGGVVMNFLLGIVSFFVYLLIVGKFVILPNLVEYNFWASNYSTVESPLITFVQGEKNQDLEYSIILSVNDEKIDNVERFVELLDQNWDKSLDLTYYKNSRIIEGQFNLGGKYDTQYSHGFLNKIVITSLVENSPASKSGLQKGDVILSIAESNIDSEGDFSNLLETYKGQEVQFDIFRQESRAIETINVSLNDPQDTEERILGAGYYLNTPNGISLYVINYSNPLVGSVQHSFNLMGYQIKALGRLLSDSVDQGDISIVGDNVSGPIRIGSEIAKMVNANNFIDLLNLFGLISLALAFMNLLPLPVVDGGHVVLLGLEKLRGRGLSPRSQAIYNLVGLVFIIGLSIIVTLKDLFQVFVRK